MTLRRNTLIRLCILLACTAPLARPDTGVLIPKDSEAPDPSVLSLDEMQVEVTIDDGDAHVHIVQIFANHTEKIQEGTYRFALPTGSTVSDFAVWDGPVRIPAVILERKRAEQIYEQAKSQAIDPGLLKMGERTAGDGDDQNPRQAAIFTAQIVPIPAYGTKRLELDYHQRITSTGFKQAFSLPLKPDANQTQTVKHFHLQFSLHSSHSIGNFQSPMRLDSPDAHSAKGTLELNAQPLSSDFQVTWALSPEAADKLEVITHREPTPPPGPVAVDPQGRGTPGSNGHGLPPLPGVFEAQLLLAEPGASAPATPAAPRTLVILFDNSLSMQWEKLERSYAALEATLHSLTPADYFNVLLFNQAVTPFKPSPVAADPATVQAALDFVRASRLRGGTDLLKALNAGLAQATTQPGENTTLVLLSDGGSDRGETVVPAKIATRYAAAWKQTPHPPHTAVFAIGDDANAPLLRNLAHQNGFLEQVLSTEPIEFHLQSFLARLTSEAVKGLALAAPQQASLVYSLDDAVYPGSMAGWVGQYLPTDAPATFTATATRGGSPGTQVSASTQAKLAVSDLNHPQLPRLWAQARVDALLAQIDRDGETQAAIEEIIQLSRRYKFVTPYTSFLAVPHALLRPRVIRPGDPVLRVRTDTAITSVIALFPFGLTKPLRHLASDDLKAPGDQANSLWETRFLAPTDMKDGTYNVRLILRDKAGNTYNEAKTFVIASTPPTVKLELSSAALHRGQALQIKAQASQSTRTLTAHLEGINPVTLHWNSAARANTGTLVIPPTLPIGRYRLTVTAEDIAHNLGTQEVQVDVLP